jgi:hypothetical protein
MLVLNPNPESEQSPGYLVTFSTGSGVEVVTTTVKHRRMFVFEYDAYKEYGLMVLGERLWGAVALYLLPTAHGRREILGKASVECHAKTPPDLEIRLNFR